MAPSRTISMRRINKFSQAIAIESKRVDSESNSHIASLCLTIWLACFLAQARVGPYGSHQYSLSVLIVIARLININVMCERRTEQHRALPSANYLCLPNGGVFPIFSCSSNVHFMGTRHVVSPLFAHSAASLICPFSCIFQSFTLTRASLEK